RVEHRLLGNGVEDDAADLLVLEHPLLVQNVEHMPGDGLTLAVRVGRQNDAVGILYSLSDFGQPLGGGAVHLPRHGEVLVRTDPSLAGRSRTWPKEARTL